MKSDRMYIVSLIAGDDPVQIAGDDPVQDIEIYIIGSCYAPNEKTALRELTNDITDYISDQGVRMEDYTMYIFAPTVVTVERARYSFSI